MTALLTNGKKETSDMSKSNSPAAFFSFILKESVLIPRAPGDAARGPLLGPATELADGLPEARPEGRRAPGKCPFQLFTSQVLFVTKIGVCTFDLQQRGEKVK